MNYTVQYQQMATPPGTVVATLWNDGDLLVGIGVAKRNMRDPENLDLAKQIARGRAIKAYRKYGQATYVGRDRVSRDDLVKGQ